MMIKLQATVALIFISLNLGCITGITNGYNRLSKEQKERISFDELISKARFLAINGKEMRKKNHCCPFMDTLLYGRRLQAD